LRLLRPLQRRFVCRVDRVWREAGGMMRPFLVSNTVCLEWFKETAIEGDAGHTSNSSRSAKTIDRLVDALFPIAWLLGLAVCATSWSLPCLVDATHIPPSRPSGYGARVPVLPEVQPWQTTGLTVCIRVRAKSQSRWPGSGGTIHKQRVSVSYVSDSLRSVKRFSGQA
jgi:hypothetical protein